MPILAALGLLTSSGHAGTGNIGQAHRSAQAWVSSADGRQRLALMAPLPIERGPASGAVIRLDPAQQYQQIEGFGAALTDTSAWLIHHRLSPRKRAALLQELFGRDQNRGLGLSLTRITVGASDFSRTHYSYDDMPEGTSDPTLSQFSIQPARLELLPVLKQIKAIAPSLRVFAAPWSAPGWMKTSNSLIKGRLAPQYFAAYARYLDLAVHSFQAEGVPIYALTVQNEPGFEPANYPGMLMTAPERAEFIGKHLGPLLTRNHRNVRILEWDHNWDKPQEPLQVLGDPVARIFVAGTAWHCYGGEPSAQSEIHQAYPAKETWFTECSGGDWAPDWGDSLAWQTRNLIIGTIRNWAKGVIVWNLALDQNSGPHLGGCGNCRGVVTIDQATGAVSRNVEYYVMGHASRFVMRGARRIASDTNVAGLETVAFRNPKAGSVVLIALNTGTETRSFAVQVGQDHISTSLQSGSVMTLTWPQAQRIQIKGVSR